MRPSLIAIAICVASFSLPSTTYAQAFPEIHLADIPAEVANGDRYQICGTVIGIADGTTVYVTVGNIWMNMPGTSGNSTITATVNVSGGAFCTTRAFTFNGAGFYFVDVLVSTAAGFESGSVAAP